MPLYVVMGEGDTYYVKATDMGEAAERYNKKMQEIFGTETVDPPEGIHLVCEDERLIA